MKNPKMPQCRTRSSAQHHHASVTYAQFTLLNCVLPLKRRLIRFTSHHEPGSRWATFGASGTIFGCM